MMASIPELRRAIRLEIGRGAAGRFRRLSRRLDSRFEFRAIYSFGSNLPSYIDATERIDPGGPIEAVEVTQPPWRGVREAIRIVGARVAEQLRHNEERETARQKLIESRN